MSLSVILETPDGTRGITSQVSNLSIKNSSPGGFASVEFDLPRRLDQSRLGKSSVRVYLSETGEQVGGGRLIEQGMSSDGLWHMSFLGEGLAALQDIDEPYMVIDSDLRPYSRSEQVGVKIKTIGGKQRKRSKSSAEVGFPKQKIVTGIVAAEAKVSSAPDGSEVEGLLFQIPEGTTVAMGASITATVRGPWLCGQRLGGYGYRFLGGANTSEFQLRAAASKGIAVGPANRLDNLTSAETPMTWKTWADFGDADGLAIWLIRVAGSGAVGGNRWAHVRGLVVRARLIGRDGAELPAPAYAGTWARATDVFYDLIARRCPTLKLGDAVTSQHQFTQLAWYDGITAKEVLDELCEADGTVTYHAWGEDESGKTVINLDPVSTTVRYELSTKHGFSAPSPSSEVYDRVVVIAPTPDGHHVRLVVSRNTDGNPRSQTINLDAYPAGGLAAVANQFLDAYAAPPNAGTITVAERVLDLWTGRWVHPVAIRSGHLCRVRGVQPTPDTLNPEAKQDGVTIFRIATNTHSDGVSTLELDQPVLNQDRALAALLS